MYNYTGPFGSSNNSGFGHASQFFTLHSTTRPKNIRETLARLDRMFSSLEKPSRWVMTNHDRQKAQLFTLGPVQVSGVPQVSASGSSESEQGCRERRMCSSVHCSSGKACSSRVNWPCLVRISSFTWAHEDSAAAHRHWLFSWDRGGAGWTSDWVSSLYWLFHQHADQ